MTRASCSVSTLAAISGTTALSMCSRWRRRGRQGRRSGPAHADDLHGSAVIHDIKGENWALTAGWRSRFSHCLLFDPTDPPSARFNPLLEVHQGAHEVRDVQNIADILVEAPRSGAITGKRPHTRS
jgi:hypothetical protein